MVLRTLLRLLLSLILTTSNQYKKSLLFDLFQEDTSDKTAPPHFLTVTNKDAREDDGRIFLCHAQVYVLAEKYEVEALKQLSLSKLRHALITFKQSEERSVDDVVTLLRYVYENTVDLASSEEKLRALVVHYTACVVEELTPNLQFQALLESEGALGRDLLKRLTSRLD